MWLAQRLDSSTVALGLVRYRCPEAFQYLEGRTYRDGRLVDSFDQPLGWQPLLPRYWESWFGGVACRCLENWEFAERSIVVPPNGDRPSPVDSVQEAALFKWAADSGWQYLSAVSEPGDTLATYTFRRKARTDVFQQCIQDGL